MHNLPLHALVLTCLIVGVVFSRKSTRAFFKDLFSVVEDRWTWTTQTGEIYENAQIRHLDDEELILEHSWGVTRISIESLSDKSHDLLLHSREWRDHASFVPESSQRPHYSSQPLQASHAA